MASYQILWSETSLIVYQDKEVIISGKHEKLGLVKKMLFEKAFCFASIWIEFSDNLPPIMLYGFHLN